ncbi:SDR family NAD(P)-dependent oxidoreductase [Lentibacter sp. XHP0401]|uniref:SDR family NAD(P)-dependent oxidoreductase n=1 Tax=Lentibacter sp. XHP0401 TaxID=2984334 RepID=UPI0021E8BA2B|nr:SDR family oxidoreductase [Lentibacter sp. XHP0401]MCV2894656.1 SDR family oxidoreductase [Lentibacter sp. XHP0401]
MNGTFSKDIYADKVVLVTGASSGIGKAIALAFRDHGATVHGTASSEKSAALLRNAGITVHICDVRDDPAVDTLLETFERLDVLVTAAGVARRVDEYKWSVFRDVMEVNLFGTARFALGARDLLAASQGSIVTVSSMLSIFGDKLVPSYAASKGGVSQLTKSLAIEYGQQGIRVNAIAPGWIDTNMTDSLVQDEEVGPAIAGRTVFKRWGKPEEVASAVLYLASPAATYVTGTTLIVDGGYSIT